MYEGEWVKDEMHGSGVYTWPDGRKYYGDFQHGKKHGRGTIEEHSGIYSGEWVNGMKHGNGQLTYPDGRVVRGTWHENVLKQIISQSDLEQVAEAVEEAPLDSANESSMREERKSPRDLPSSDHKSVKGEPPHERKSSVSDSERPISPIPQEQFSIESRSVQPRDLSTIEVVEVDEQGRLKALESVTFPSSVNPTNFASTKALAKRRNIGGFPFGSVPSEGGKFTNMVLLTPTVLYRGELDDKNLRQGRGICLQDGEIWEGLWDKDQMEGLGRRIEPDGAVYFGFWADGLAHGFGVHTTANGVIYSGEWLRGAKDGLGFEHGDMVSYRGEFRSNYKQGQGRLELPREGVYIGTFDKDLRDGFGVWISLEGSKYAGGWREDRMDGAGVQSWTDGRHFTGHYKENRQGKGSYRRYLKESIDPESLFKLNRSQTLPAPTSKPTLQPVSIPQKPPRKEEPPVKPLLFAAAKPPPEKPKESLPVEKVLKNPFTAHSQSSEGEETPKINPTLEPEDDFSAAAEGPPENAEESDSESPPKAEEKPAERPKLKLGGLTSLFGKKK